MHPQIAVGTGLWEVWWKENFTDSGKQYELPCLYLRDFKALKHCTSIAQFKVQLEDYLEKLETSYEVHAALLRLGERI